MLGNRKTMQVTGYGYASLMAIKKANCKSSPSCMFISLGVLLQSFATNVLRV